MKAAIILWIVFVPALLLAQSNPDGRPSLTFMLTGDNFDGEIQYFQTAAPLLRDYTQNNFGLTGQLIIPVSPSLSLLGNLAWIRGNVKAPETLDFYRQTEELTGLRFAIGFRVFLGH